MMNNEFQGQASPDFIFERMFLAYTNEMRILLGNSLPSAEVVKEKSNKKRNKPKRQQESSVFVN